MEKTFKEKAFSESPKLKQFDKEKYFIKATGTKESPGFVESKTPLGKGQDTEIGSYGFNNNTLAFVDENGDYWVGRGSKEAVQALEEAGYENHGVYVPHSNDSGSWMSQNFDNPRKQIAETERIRKKVEAIINLLKPFDKEKYFIKATGTKESPGFVESKTPLGKGQDTEIGSYGFNNNTLAFVDENGDYWVGRGSKEAVQALEEAGYENNGVYVPHSNDSGSWMSQNFDNR